MSEASPSPRLRRLDDAELVALPVLSADALASVAYGPQAMLGVVVLAGSGGLALSLPIAEAIAFLILSVGISYRQTIRAYPHGGGSYIVGQRQPGPRQLPVGGASASHQELPDNRDHRER
jgi:hypothetical protein